MQLSVAQQAGTLAAEVAAYQALVNAVTQAIADQAIIVGTSQIADPTNNVSSFNLPALTAAESAAVFNAVLTVFNNRLSAANAQLAAM